MKIRMYALGCLLAAQLAAQQEAPQPALALSVSVNGRADITAYRGWPVFVDALVFLQDAEKVQLAVEDGSWTAALKLAVVPATGNGQDVSGRFALLPAAAAQVELKDMEQAAATWFLTGEQSRSLAPGDYSVRVGMDLRVVAGGSPGLLQSRLVELHVEDPPEQLTVELLAEQALLSAREKEETGDGAEALRILDGFLSGRPESVAALDARAGLLGRLERWPEAAAGYEAALSALRKVNPGMMHQPLLLLRKRNEAVQRALAANPPGD